MKEKIKKYLGELLIIIGTGIFINNLFNFSYRTEYCSGALPSLPSLGGCEKITGVAYYYSDNVILWLTIGGILLVLGVLIIRNKSK